MSHQPAKSEAAGVEWVPRLLIDRAAEPVDWSTPEGVADAARRFTAMAVAAEEMAGICRRFAHTLTHDHPDKGDPHP